MITNVDKQGERRVSGAVHASDPAAHTVDTKALLRTAFGDRPESAIRVSPAAPPVARWLAAVALGARGRYAAATALLAGLHGRRDVDPAVRAHAAVTRAAHLRQAGGHLAARRWDGLGLALATAPHGGAPYRRAPHGGATPGGATSIEAAVGEVAPGEAGAGAGGGAVGGAGGAGGAGLDLAAARADALLGLAADAIGLADLELADRLLRLAEPAALEHPSWRPGVRWHWVRAELALSRERPEPALELARRALAGARAAGAVRHEVKSAIVVAVAEAGSGREAEKVIADLGALSERTRQTGLWTLEWPIQLLLHTLTGDTDPARSTTHRSQAVQIVSTISLHSDVITRSVLSRSPWVPDVSETKLLHLDPYHPAEKRRSAHSSRMECKNKP